MPMSSSPDRSNRNLVRSGDSPLPHTTTSRHISWFHPGRMVFEELGCCLEALSSTSEFFKNRPPSEPFHSARRSNAYPCHARES